MEYYRHGCCYAGVNAPGGNVLIGLMSELEAPSAKAPDRLLLAEAQMTAGMSSALASQPHAFLAHIVAGSVLASIGKEEARLIAGDTLRVPSGAELTFSTRGTLGMRALLILPQESTSRFDDSCSLPVCGVDGMFIRGEPQGMAMNSLAILRSLTPLTSDGCLMPTVQMTRGNFNRNGIFAALLPQYAADPMALRAFIWECNAYLTPWWQNRDSAQRRIVEGVTKLLKAQKQSRG